MKGSHALRLAALALVAAAPAAADRNDRNPPADTGAKPLKSRELKTERAGIELTLYNKYNAAEENNFKQNGRVVLLVHGATWSSKCTFDPAPGYSMMDTLAEAGFDVWAVDLHGYGKSGRTDHDWTEASQAADDVDAAVDYIRALRWVEKVSVFGYQWGAQPVGLFAQKHAKKVAKVVLFGMRYQSTENKAEPQSQYRRNSMQTASLMPSDGDLDPEFARQRATVCAENDPQSPNGAVRDLNRASPVDPAQLHSPTLLIMGDREITDANVLQDRIDFFRGLTSRSKWFVVLPGLGKYATVERGHARFDTALTAFLTP
jgi:pimeloyl-ACP methyl ester carboxylesterase